MCPMFYLLEGDYNAIPKAIAGTNRSNSKRSSSKKDNGGQNKTGGRNLNNPKPKTLNPKHET